MSVTFSLDPERVGWIVFDTPDSAANILTEDVREALAAALDKAEASAALALVICSAKERIFIAGADLQALQALSSTADAEALSRSGQRLFQRVASQRVPLVCAIHGACAGGGYELPLACDWRIASDSPATQIGLPETSLGTLPGWGGCVRLPRLIGAEAALDHILRAQLLDAHDALRAGLVDEVVPPGHLKAHARAIALRFAAEGHPRRSAPPPFDRQLFEALRERVTARTRGQLPAPLAAIRAVAEGLGAPIPDALAIEARLFGEVTAGEVCHHLIHAFLLREQARKRTLGGWFDEAATPTRQIRRVGVVGAGVMGSGIAHWLASRGYDVVLRDVQLEFLERALGVIRGLLDDGVKRGKWTAQDADVVFGRIRTTTEWEGFSECDLVIEAIVEDVAAKRTLFSELADVVAPDALLASNTSALPIEDIAAHVAHPERTLGIHFFNPVSRMPLVELVLGRKTDARAASTALAFVRKLGKSPVICRSSPGFLVTRVLFFYLNAAVARWEAGVPAATIDDALRAYGWPMGPLRLIDEVGVDVTAFIFSEMAQYFPGRFQPTQACARLAAAGLKGRKNGASRGFYSYEGGRDASNEAEARRVSGAGDTGFRQPAASELVDELMRVMVDEARRCLAEGVVRSSEDVDFALLSGAGFPAFRGGLLRWAAQHVPSAAVGVG